MTKRLLINVDSDERRIAIVEAGRLENLAIEYARDVQNRGNIFKGIVQRVEPSLQAAFVDYGGRRDGFLSLDEILPSLNPKDGDRRPPIQKILKPRQPVLVQVAKDEVGTKGAALTTYVSLAGRFLVLMPESDRTGISRKLPEEDRARIKDVLAEIEVPSGFGVIVRTAAKAVTKADATRDLSYLTRLWSGVTRQFEEMKGPGLIYEESNLAIRFVRDYFSNEIEEIWVDDPATWQEVMDFVSVLMPKQQQKVRLYAENEPLFSRFQIEEQIDAVFSRRVRLPSGGSIVIDETEALVAIDVNSGKTKEKDAEETVYQTNMEAAEEIARQVVLRDLGGLIVIDFIDMRDTKHMRKVEAALKAAFKNDKARLRFGRISTFGMLELSRQRLKSSLWSTSFTACAHCDGTGRMRTEESSALRVLRRIKAVAASGKAAFVHAELPPALAHYLLNRRRRELSAIERDCHTRIEIFDDPAIFSNNVEIGTFETEPMRPATTVKPPRVELRKQAPPVETTRRGEPALSMYDPSLFDAEVEVEDDEPAIHEPEATVVEAPAPAPTAPAAPVESPAARPAPSWTAPAAMPSSASPSAWVPPRAAPAPQPEAGTSRPWQWLRRLLGGAEPEPRPEVRPEPRPEPRPVARPSVRSIVVPLPPSEEPPTPPPVVTPPAPPARPVAAVVPPIPREVPVAAPSAPPAPSAPRPRREPPPEPEEQLDDIDIVDESEDTDEGQAGGTTPAAGARKRRRRGGRNRRKPTDGATPTPDEEARRPEAEPEKAAAPESKRRPRSRGKDAPEGTPRGNAAAPPAEPPAATAGEPTGSVDGADKASRRPRRRGGRRRGRPGGEAGPGADA